MTFDPTDFLGAADFTSFNEPNSEPPPSAETYSSTVSTTPASPSTGKKHEPSPSDDADVSVKRQRNTLAARKYRQKRLDRIKELEDALQDVTRERDELRLRLARQEAETTTLKEVMRLKSGE